MAETAITAVLSKLGDLAASEAKVLLEVGDNMMLLRDRLEWLQAFLRDADRKRRAGTDQLTRVWVRQTRDVAFQAEDALDEFIYEVDLKSQGYQGWKMWCRYLTGFCTQIVIRHGLYAKIKSINRRLEKISENQKEYKIKNTPLAPVTSSTTATSAWRDDYKNAVGFDDDVMTLEEMLLHKDHPRLMFISILGESGVGKRTLAKIVSEKMKVNFHLSLRFHKSPDSTTEDLLKEIYDRIYIEYCTTEWIEDYGQLDEEIDIVDKIRCLLRYKRYLLMIGGISSKTMANCLKACLPDDNNGSRVVFVLDTEDEEVAWHANTMNKEGINGIHMLSRLDEERSGQLFCSRVFRKDQYNEEGNMRKYNKSVYNITGGYPLAIVLLAGLLRFKEKPGQWEAVLEQLMSESGMEKLQDGKGNQITGAVIFQEEPHLSTRTTIERVFWESFEDLPNDLKSCFLYFAAFPKNTGHSAHIIVWMWMAEGFIKPQKGNTIEEVGHSYLKEIVLRCLLESMGMNYDGSIKEVRVHKSLHGFLHSEAREAGFIELHDTHDIIVAPLARRLSFMSFGGRRYTNFTNKFPKLRSFICWVKELGWSNGTQDMNKKFWHDLKFLLGSKFLRVLSIWGLRIRKLPDEIGNIIHLRYLSVDSEDLKELPSSIKRLLNLQTLDIRDTRVEDIHQSFWKIKTLRHVLADNLTLPASITEELDELQTLHGVKPAGETEWHQHNCPLHKMTKLRSLKLFGIMHDKHGAALESALTKMHLLGRLTLKGDVLPLCVFTAQSLRYLQKISLYGSVEWPEASLNVRTVRPNLVKVKLENSDEVPQHIGAEIVEALIE
ncbi:hypothetical protein BS78_K035700, partial [Paspalum vaginatum]